MFFHQPQGLRFVIYFLQNTIIILRKEKKGKIKKKTFFPPLFIWFWLAFCIGRRYLVISTPSRH